MKLYLSFGYVDEKGESNRLFHLEQPVDGTIARKLADFVKKYLDDLVH